MQLISVPLQFDKYTDSKTLKQFLKDLVSPGAQMEFLLVHARALFIIFVLLLIGSYSQNGPIEELQAEVLFYIL
jgi:hypothetical protein